MTSIAASATPIANELTQINTLVSEQGYIVSWGGGQNLSPLYLLVISLSHFPSKVRKVLQFSTRSYDDKMNKRYLR